MCSLSLYKRNHPDRLRKHVLKFQFGVSRSEALQLIFGHLPYIELRKCMMVSKVWRKLALDELDVRYSVIISTEDQANVVLQKLRTTSQSFRVGSVASSGLSLESLPLQILLGKVQNTLNLLKVDTPVGVTESLLHQVLANLPNLTHFSMTFIGASGSKLNDKNDCVNFPLLGTQFSLSTSEKKLNKEVGGLGNYHSSDAINMCNQQLSLVQKNLFAHQNIRYLQLDLGQNATFQLSKIFQAFPNLIELAIANILDEPRRHFRSLPQEASSSQSYHQHHEHPGQKLKRLSLRQYSNLGFSEKLLQTLMRLNMHLEKLELVFHPPSLSSTSSQVLKTLPVSSLLRQFIESQAATLRCLKLAQVEDDLCLHSQNNNKLAASGGNTVGSSLASNYYWNFNYSSPSASVSLLPLSLSRLEELHVQKPLITNLAQILNHFPKLTALSLQLSHGSNWQGFLPSRLEPHEHITRLKIDFIDADSFSKLGYCFPSLQTLQLAFCDLTLFKVLCELMPYFSGYGRGNRGNLVSCQQCHGTSQEFIVPKKNKNDAKSFSGGAGGPPATFHNGNVGIRASANNATFAFCKNSNNDDDDHESVGTLKTSQVPFDRLNLEYVMQHTRKKYPFKNLSLLRLRPCHHSPFENFVFLQRDRQGPIKQDLDLHYPNASFDNENLFESDSCIGFSYDSTSVMKQEKFVELAAHPFDEDHELCSTA